MTDEKKCGNEACSCVPKDKEKYCSAACEAMKGAVEVICKCVHPGCRGNATRV
jgi:hypothetical protein